ncbi:hypothetical protein L1277_001682 [Okibacterium sp. HSC-33S16]|uniref:hypothetical protein n=1 Tax=Okibacterium sp. HSC-33S16 TaxID=2910965 RepID=UPI0020A1E9D2|nr:hypothetical protein [Okibacterium sp. HSC-33S16]MCP2031591.1 hypothetical protein [Okibacterium sp. HSC-33S16]
MNAETTLRPTRSDRADLWTVLVVGAIVATGALVHAVMRIVSVVSNTDVEVIAPFAADTRAAVPVGPNGTPLDVQVDTAVLTVSGLPVIVVVSLVFAAVAELLMTLGIVACAALVCRNLMRGQAFSRTNTRLVFATSITIIVGTTLVNLFSTMGANGALAKLSDKTFDGFVAGASLVPYFIAIALGAVALAFKAGERLQRDTEGLV